MPRLAGEIAQFFDERNGSCHLFYITTSFFNFIFSAAVGLLALAAEANLYSASTLVILDSTKHLGMPGQPEWAWFEGKVPHGTNLVMRFDAPVGNSSKEQTLFIRQDDVKQEWTVSLNGKRLGFLFLMEAPVMHTLAIPPGLLKQKDNIIEIATRSVSDDILIHELSVMDISKAALFSDSTLQIAVQEAGADSSQPFPCRITILDERKHLAANQVFGAQDLATRPGVIYTATGKATVGLAPGKYTVYVTRGPEFSLGQKVVSIPTSAPLNLSLERVVQTSGWVAADTHIHTFTFSRHGDATLDERVITLAGEAVELPIVTEHNQHADYSPAVQKLGLSRFFTLVPGNEVTTKKGHFNIFPVRKDANPPDYTLEQWPELLQAIRKTPNVQLAILNHPTDAHNGFTPFADTNLNLVSGRNLRGNFDFTFDAMEVINSGAMRSDWMEPFRAWFALLNSGRRVTAIAASDSHDVSRFIVGQGRTYIRTKDDDLEGIDISQACRNLKDGHAIVSLGLFVNLTISGANRGGPGDLVSCSGDQIEIEARISSPEWMRATRAVLYANGRAIHEFNIPHETPGPIELRKTMSTPAFDTYYVLIAQGPGVTDQYWAVARPYQPSSRNWNPVVIGATNPVWVDGDRDGKFTPPNVYAQQLVSTPSEQMLSRLEKHDWAVATQMADLLYTQGVNLQAHSVLTGTSNKTQSAFIDFLKTVQQ